MFQETDIVVFDGVISRYSIFKILNIKDDELRRASWEEREIYYNRPER